MKIKGILNLALIALFLFIFVQTVSATSDISLLPNECLAKEGCSLCNFLDLFINGANILVGLSGTFAILMFIFGGMLMITAYGNEARIKWGKDVLMATVTGIVIVLFAWTIVNLIIGALFGGKNVPEWANLNRDGICNSQQSGGGLSPEERERINSLPI